jgi:hypothetical protein
MSMLALIPFALLICSEGEERTAAPTLQLLILPKLGHSIRSARRSRKFLYANWNLCSHGRYAPNELKLSDRRSGRGTCRWVERWRWYAAGAVTVEPVRCSAWFGVAVKNWMV